jgi:hypothetical protein
MRGGARADDLLIAPKAGPEMVDTVHAKATVCIDCGCEYMVNRKVAKQPCVRCGSKDTFPKTPIER